ncbi:MAG: AAA family ATPase [Gemmataceae bacterium]
MQLTFPELSLVLLVGPSGCGKSTFACCHFRPTDTVSDHYRGVVCDDEANQAASREAFELVHAVVERQLQWRRFTVVDATNLQPAARKPLLDLARRHHYLTSAVVFDLAAEGVPAAEPATNQPDGPRPRHHRPPGAARRGGRQCSSARAWCRDEHPARCDRGGGGHRPACAVVDRQRHERGPFDVIGDVHGWSRRTVDLLTLLDYRVGFQPDPLGACSRWPCCCRGARCSSATSATADRTRRGCSPVIGMVSPVTPCASWVTTTTNCYACRAATMSTDAWATC